MKLVYSTYGMQGLDIFAALPRLRDMGYEGIEIAVTPGWPTEPARLDGTERKRLAALLRELGYETPPLMALLNPCVEGPERAAMLAQFEATFDLARDLRVSEAAPVVTTTLGHPQPAWDTGKERIAELVSEVADLAALRDVKIALEPHAGHDFESPEKAAWLMRRTDHPHLGLNFDYSHFWVEGMDLEHCIELNLPYAVHNHIKDGYLDEGRIVYLLPGDGKLDLAVYLQAMQRGGWQGIICPEVTGQIWKLDDYDPWATAQFCYDALDRARQSLS
jgi:sugar phosphate isomerase/epimerase